MTTRNCFWAALALSLAGGCNPPEPTDVLTPALTQAERHDDSPLFDRNARPFGVSMEGWAEQWWRWAYSIPAATNPFFNSTGDNSQKQRGPVYFLTNFQTGERSSTVPRHKVIALTLASIMNDYPCPDPTFQPAPGQTLFDFLMVPTKQGQDNVAQIIGSLDGVPLDNLMSYRVASDDLMYFKGDPSLQSFDECVTGSTQPAVVDSFLIMLRPLEPGQHVLETSTITQSGRVYGPHIAKLNVLGSD